MRERWLFGVFLLGSSVLGAQTQGCVEVQAEDGVLSGVQTRWSPAPGWEGRWWTREPGGGSAWIGGPGFQVGPLALSPGTEGRKTWGPGTDLASGSWGLGVDLDQGGLWAVQTPDRFEAGLQAAGEVGPWSVAAGADRTWDLGLPPGDLGPWVDRGRGGLVYRSDGVGAGFEATRIVPSLGAAGWASRSRGALRFEDLSFDAGVHHSDDPTHRGAQPWSWEGGMGWQAYRLSWEARADDPWGRGEARWRHGGTGAAVTWGPDYGAGLRGRWEGRWGPVSLRGTAEGTLVPGGWDYSGEGRVVVPWDQGQASVAWSVSPGAEAPVQTVEAGWTHRSFTVSARWKVEGFRLGWIGPGSSFRLNLTWFF